jgi:hypothetical protein
MPGQKVNPGGQPQILPIQGIRAAQTFPQMPQLFASVSVLTQTPPQILTKGLGSAQWQLPETQPAPLPQTLPHAPQF